MIVWVVGAMLIDGAFATQGVTLIDVVTLLDESICACPWRCEFTWVVFDPLVAPAFALTLRFTVVEAAGASVTEVGVVVDASNAVLFVSRAVKLNVVLEQLAPSLFVMLSV